jgi:hypothetical protein
MTHQECTERDELLRQLCRDFPSANDTVIWRLLDAQGYACHPIYVGRLRRQLGIPNCQHRSKHRGSTEH